jgi:CBS domain-containing protein
MLTVRDVMRRDVLVVAPETPLKDVAQLLIDRRVSGVPVVDDTGAVLGIVSETDFLIKEQGSEAVPHRPMSRLLGESADTRQMLAKVSAVTAGEAMTSPAVTIGPTAAISAAASLMTNRRVNRLPVISDGKLVGIVTRADLVRAYVRSDEELQSTIESEVLHRLLWLDPAGFTILVRDGIVTISGRVERESTAEMIERSIAMVPGIVDVRASISWVFEDRDIVPVERDPVFPHSPR